MLLCARPHPRGAGPYSGAFHLLRTDRQHQTVPTFVTAHTFCASRDTRVSYGWWLLIQGYFCAVENYAEKAELTKCSWYSKRELGVTMHFSEIIKLQFRKKTPYIALYFTPSLNYCCLLSLKKKKTRGYP